MSLLAAFSFAVARLFAGLRTGGDAGVLDTFEDWSRWVAAPSEGVLLAVRSDAGSAGRSLRLEFDFRGHAGWAAVRREISRRLPENWAIHLRLRGQAPRETLEFKLLDASGQNVWWAVRRDFAFPRDGVTLRIRKRQVSFAWGPAGGGTPREIGAVEIAITAGEGGSGTVWLEELSLEELPPAAAAEPVPTARASSANPGDGPERAVDGDPRTAWRSDPKTGERVDLVLDLGGRRELGGLRLDWDASDYPRNYAVELSEDGAAWSLAQRLTRARGGRAWISLPDAEASFLRLRLKSSSRGLGYALAEAEVEGPSFSETPTAFLLAVAAQAPRGEFPRSFRGEQVYWALVGVDGGRDQALLSEDGALEAGRGAFSVEPFLRIDRAFLGWAEAETSQALEEGDLPIPSVRRRYPGGISLEITALAEGPPEAPRIWARYRLRNEGTTRLRAELDLAVRPLQVNPPWQILSTPGGFAPIHRIAPRGGALDVEGIHRVLVSALTPSAKTGAWRFDGGDVVSALARGDALEPSEVSAADGFASAALRWRLDVAPGRHRDVILVVPLRRGAAPRQAPDTDSASRSFERVLSDSRREWRGKLDRVGISLPPEAEDSARAVRANLAWILVNRDESAIRPGSRSYARSWIRDGALTAAALLRLGHAEEVRDFLRWYAPYQFESGAVPCCVDARGPDPVAENDSHGELLYLAGEYFAFTGDRATIESVWAHLSRAAAYIDALRGRRRTADYRTPQKLAFFGLLPESISHEGYSARPVHSYWDDFWAVRGLSDAADLARELGKTEEAARWTASRDEMREDLMASIRRVIGSRGLDYIPGSADLGDEDATSTTIALEPGGELRRLPRRELESTFERYWQNFVARRDADDPNASYTPYEWRVVGSFLRLGRRDRARALSDYFLADRRPIAWNQWAEVVFRDARAPKFLGDMPHSWVGSDFVRSFLDGIAYERRDDGALVLAAGLPESWLRGPEGFAVRGLRTGRGRLDLSGHAQDGAWRFSIGGSLRDSPGGILLRPPVPVSARRATCNGREVPVSAEGEVAVCGVPAEIVFSSAGGPP